MYSVMWIVEPPVQTLRIASEELDKGMLVISEYSGGGWRRERGRGPSPVTMGEACTAVHADDRAGADRGGTCRSHWPG